MEQIVEEAFLRVPHLVVVLADAVHGIGDPYEMLEEPESDFLVYRVVLGEDERNLQHGQAVERHPCRAVGLVEMSAGRQRRAAVKYADVIETEEATSKDVTAFRVLAINPPVKIQHQPLE